MNPLSKNTLFILIIVIVQLCSSDVLAQCASCDITNPTTHVHFGWLNKTVCFTANTTVVNNAVVGNETCTVEICSGAAVHFQHNANLAVQACNKTIYGGSYTHGGAGTYAGFASCTDLAVVFGEFTGERVSGQVILNWDTFIQVNTDVFVVQRSKDGRVWESLDTILGAGQSRERLSYEYVDENAPYSDLIYKIVEVDFNGEIDESNLIGVDAAEFKEVNVYPNPATWSLSFDQGIENPQKLELIDDKGVILMEQEFKSTYTLTELDISTLSSGNYHLVVENDNGVFHKSFIKN